MEILLTTIAVACMAIVFFQRSDLTWLQFLVIMIALLSVYGTGVLRMSDICTSDKHQDYKKMCEPNGVKS